MSVQPDYILRCQKDSHEKELEGVEVLNCSALTEWDLGQIKGKKKGKKTAQEDSKPEPKFKVQLAETILFPEGGGQPFDLGEIIDTEGQGTVKVLRVHRSEDGATWHYTSEPVEPGHKVRVKLDWSRRFDHMQCHSGQHLVTAVAIKTLGYPTVGWSLTAAPEPCYLDLEGPSLTKDQLDKLEEDVNIEIRENKGFLPKVYSPEEFKALDDVRFKELPDTRFPIRIVEIDGLDVNTCCGTHVKSTGELQLVKILRSESAGPNTNRVYFAVGNRALNLFSRLYDNSRGLTDKLCCGMEDHLDRVEGLVVGSKSSAKTIKSMQKDLADLLGPSLLAAARQAGSKGIFCHRRDATSEFPDLLLKAISAAKKEEDPFVALILIGDDTVKGSAGAFVIAGDKSNEPLLKSLNDTIVNVFSAKGGGKGTKYQGKILPGNVTAKQIASAQEEFERALQA